MMRGSAVPAALALWCLLCAGTGAAAPTPVPPAAASPCGEEAPAPFIGNKGSRKLHCADCIWGKKVSPGKRKEFRTYQEAVAEGYFPCSACRPDIAAGLPGPPRPPVAPGEIVGSTVKDFFHRGSCEWADKISAGHLLRFKTREEAIAAGKRPCSVCKP